MKRKQVLAVIMTAALLTGACAWGAVPLPSLRPALTSERWSELSSMLDNHCRFDPQALAFSCEEGVTATVREKALEWQGVFGPDASLMYLSGLSYRYDGEPAKAAAELERALALDSAYVAAWYDLGEVRLAQGAMPAAAEAFAKVSALKTGEQSWVGPWREAEVAAHQGDPALFEERIKEALRRGFSFRQIKGLPNWKGFLNDPRVSDIVVKVLTVYGSDDVLKSLR